MRQLGWGLGCHHAAHTWAWGRAQAGMAGHESAVQLLAGCAVMLQNPSCVPRCGCQTFAARLLTLLTLERGLPMPLCSPPAGVLDESANTLFLTELWRGLAMTLKCFFEQPVTVSAQPLQCRGSRNPDMLADGMLLLDGVLMAPKLGLAGSAA